MRSWFLLLVACTASSAPPGGPRGLRASDHLAVARDEDQAARDRATWPSTQVMRPDSSEPPVQTPVQMPWSTRDAPVAHEMNARVHRSQAAALSKAYDEACVNRSGVNVTQSPLARFHGTAWNTPTGAVVYLGAEAGPPGELLAVVRCHRAWMMIAPEKDDSPFDVPGLTVDARGDRDGVTLTITVTEPKLVPELQRRIARQLESRPRKPDRLVRP